MAHPHELSEYGGFPKECSMNHYAMEQMRGPDRPFIQFLVLVDNRVSPVLDLVISDRFPTFGLNNRLTSHDLFVKKGSLS
jgi:hypothetical protein